MVNSATGETVENYFFEFTGYCLEPRRVLHDAHSRGHGPLAACSEKLIMRSGVFHRNRPFFLYSSKCVKMIYKIAEFPQSLAKPDGNILVAPIDGHSGSRKRKRSELTVALDCESINLYDVNLTTPPGR